MLRNRQGGGSTTVAGSGGGRFKGLRWHVQTFHDTLLDTFYSLEGATRWKEDEYELPMPPTHRLSVDFSKGYAELGSRSGGSPGPGVDAIDGSSVGQGRGRGRDGEGEGV